MLKESHEPETDIWQTRHGLSGECHRAYSALMRSHVTSTRRIEAITQKQGAIPLEWYDVLLALEYAPEGRLRIGNLACHISLSRSGLTRLVDRLEKEGLVDRQLNPNDRRSFEVILTPKGRAERERTWPIYARAIADVFATHYAEGEASQLADLLERQFNGNGEGELSCDGAACCEAQACDPQACDELSDNET
jgi:DNA-binding MarR family transcriptional regulator